MKLPIIVIAYNRPRSLERLLKSLLMADYGETDIEIILSIDYSENTEVRALCELFDWPFGNKEVITHENLLGLKNHVMFCGDLAAQKNGAIILEDDLVVSKFYYEYATRAAEYYLNDTNIAGISLYNYQYTETRHLPFKSLDLGFDTYFMQVASSWGQIWNAHHWNAFKAWLNDNPSILPNEIIPDHLLSWGGNSWKRDFNRYLIASNKYFVYPRSSYSTNFEDLGTHASTKGLFQVDLVQGSKNFKFDDLSISTNRYDGWFELEPNCLASLNPKLREHHFVTDLYGSKNLQVADAPTILTSRQVSESIESWSDDMDPFAQNVIQDIIGSGIYLSNKGYVTEVTKTHVSRFDQTLALQPSRDEHKTNIVIHHQNASFEMLKETVGSAVNQSNSAWLILVVTPHSEISSALADLNLPLSTLAVSESSGLQWLEEVLPFLVGEYSFILNSGDILEPDALAVGSNILSKHGDVDWLAGTTLTSNAFLPISRHSIVKDELKSTRQITASLSSSLFRTEWLRNERVQGAMKCKSASAFCTQMASLFPLPYHITHPLVQRVENAEGLIFGAITKSVIDHFVFFLCKWLSKITKSTIPHILFNGYFNRPDTFRFDMKNNTWYRERF